MGYSRACHLVWNKVANQLLQMCLGSLFMFSMFQVYKLKCLDSLLDSQIFLNITVTE